MLTSETDHKIQSEVRHYRHLWSAVVLQAKDDVENQPLDSIEFTQAVAFFIGSGDWVQNRTAIGDFLNLHRDDLEKAGRRCINRRRVSAALEPLLPKHPWPTTARAPAPVRERGVLASSPESDEEPGNALYPHGLFSPVSSNQAAW